MRHAAAHRYQNSACIQISEAILGRHPHDITALRALAVDLRRCVRVNRRDSWPIKSVMRESRDLAADHPSRRKTGVSQYRTPRRSSLKHQIRPVNPAAAIAHAQSPRLVGACMQHNDRLADDQRRLQKGPRSAPPERRTPGPTTGTGAVRYSEASGRLTRLVAAMPSRFIFAVMSERYGLPPRRTSLPLVVSDLRRLVDHASVCAVRRLQAAYIPTGSRLTPTC